MISNNDKVKITNRKIGQCFGELLEADYVMPKPFAQCVKKWFHKLSDELILEISNNKESTDDKEINHNK